MTIKTVSRISDRLRGAAKSVDAVIEALIAHRRVRRRHHTEFPLLHLPRRGGKERGARLPGREQANQHTILDLEPVVPQLFGVILRA